MKQAACVFISYGGKVVLTTRRNSEQVGLPGGKVDPGETPLVAACREVFEETSIVLEPDQLQKVFEGVCLSPVDGDSVDYHVTCYKCVLDELPVVKSQEDGINAFLGNASDLVENSPFANFNRRLLHEMGLSEDLACTV